ncbi:MAG: hypothetical protein RR515_03635 [Clostridium sp.]
MNKKSKKLVSTSLTGVMVLTGIVSAVSVSQVKVVQAASGNMQALNAKVEKITSSIKKNYLGLKNVGQWQQYIKEAKQLLAKIPNGATKTKYADSINRAEALINAAARVNQVEKSMTANTHVINNVEQWDKYITLAKTDLKKVDLKEFKNQYNELIERTAKKSAEINTVKVKYQESYKRVEVILNQAKELVKTDKVKALDKFREARSAGSKLQAHSLKNTILQSINKGISQVLGNSPIMGDAYGLVNIKDINSILQNNDLKVSNAVIGRDAALNLNGSSIEFVNVKATKKTNVTLNIASGEKVVGGQFDTLTIKKPTSRSLTRKAVVISLDNVVANKLVVDKGIVVQIEDSSKINGVYIEEKQAVVENGVIKDTVAPTATLLKGSNENNAKIEFSENLFYKNSKGEFVEIPRGDIMKIPGISFKVLDKAGKEVEGAITGSAYKSVENNQRAEIKLDFAKGKIVNGVNLIVSGEGFDSSGNKLEIQKDGIVASFKGKEWVRTTIVSDKGALEAINNSTKETIQGILETNAQDIGIDLVDYNTLSDEGKKAVAMEIFQELEEEREDGKDEKDKDKDKKDQISRDKQLATDKDKDKEEDDDDEDEDEDEAEVIGFESLDEVKEEFEDAVGDQLEEEGKNVAVGLLDEINKASSEDTFAKLVIENAKILDVDLDEYEELSDDGKKQVFKTLLDKRPANGFKNSEALEDMFEDIVEDILDEDEDKPQVKPDTKPDTI